MLGSELQEPVADLRGAVLVAVARVVVVVPPHRALVAAADPQREQAALHVTQRQVVGGQPVAEETVGVDQILQPVRPVEAEQALDEPLAVVVLRVRLAGQHELDGR